MSSAGASPPERRDERRAGGEETRRDVGEETRRDVGEARARVARAPEGEVARASSSAIRRRLALASEGTGALATLRRRVDAARVVAAVARGSIDRRDARVARVSVVGVCRGGRSVGGIGERASQRRGRSKHAGARGTTSDAGRTEAVGAGAASDAARVDRRGDVRVGVGLTIASDDADSRERVSRSARRIRPCPPTIARGGEGILGRLDRKETTVYFSNHEVQIKPSFLGSIRKPAAWVFLGLWKYFSRKEKPPSLPEHRPLSNARQHVRTREVVSCHFSHHGSHAHSRQGYERFRSALQALGSFLAENYQPGGARHHRQAVSLPPLRAPSDSRAVPGAASRRGRRSSRRPRAVSRAIRVTRRARDPLGRDTFFSPPRSIADPPRLRRSPSSTQRQEGHDPLPDRCASPR